ncbi:hypothetical protein BJX99DRAFT_265637, partial [Aspergillus californicus]
MHPHHYLLPVFLLLSQAFARPASQTLIIPPEQIAGPSTPDTTVGLNAFDGSHITTHNGSAYEWWYFDAVSTDGSAAVVAQFYPALYPDANALILSIVFPNGTVFAPLAHVGALELSTVGDGSRGYVQGGAFTWFGASDLSSYHLTLDLPDLGISGEIIMRSRARAHVASGENVPGASFGFAPDLFWANPVPDSYASVDLVVDGEALGFEGFGYHDQNWGAANYQTELTQWYWGHSSVGSYSLVFFYFMDHSMEVSSSAYLSVNGTVIVEGSSKVKVSPRGPGVSIPEKRVGRIEGWVVEIDDPAAGQFYFDIENTLFVDQGNPT